jgi:hypothetical protein
MCTSLVSHSGFAESIAFHKFQETEVSSVDSFYEMIIGDDLGFDQ